MNELYEIPRYTTYEISGLLRKKMKNVTNVEEYCERNSIDKELLKVMLKETKVFSFEMYTIAGQILNMTIDELTVAEDSSIQKKFRKKLKCENIDIKDELAIAEFLFNEIVINAKLNSGLGSEINE